VSPRWRLPGQLSTEPRGTVADACLFCRIIAGEIPAKLIAENAHCVAFRDINPQAPTHVLIIPREHVASLNEAKDPAMIGQLALMASEIARQEGIADRGYRTVFNTNGDAGQTVFHLHMHLLGGRTMKWPPG
jgi:histidine triad (HIT) family protein